MNTDIKFMYIKILLYKYTIVYVVNLPKHIKILLIKDNKQSSIAINKD